MNTFHILFLILVFVGMVAIPYMKKSKLFQFCMLMVLPFIICYLAFSSYQLNHGMTSGSIFLMLFLIAGLIYQAIMFYRRHLHEG